MRYSSYQKSIEWYKIPRSVVSMCILQKLPAFFIDHGVVIYKWADFVYPAISCIDKQVLSDSGHDSCL